MNKTQDSINEVVTRKSSNKNLKACMEKSKDKSKEVLTEKQNGISKDKTTDEKTLKDSEAKSVYAEIMAKNKVVVELDITNNDSDDD